MDLEKIPAPAVVPGWWQDARRLSITTTQYLQMGKHGLIGSERNYHKPKVAITVERCNDNNIIDVVVELDRGHKRARVQVKLCTYLGVITEHNL